MPQNIKFYGIRVFIGSHRYRLHSPFLPSIIQTKTKQFLQLDILLPQKERPLRGQELSGTRQGI